jgi:hypothetical protein
MLQANLIAKCSKFSDWSTRMLHADLQFPTQQEWQRKEQLYTQIIDLFDRYPTGGSHHFLATVFI